MSLYQIQQSTTAYPLVFLMIDASDGVTGKTGLSPTVTLSKAGGSFGSPSGSVTEIADGWYKVAGNATDVGTLGSLTLHASASGANPTDAVYEVIAVNPQSSSYGLPFATSSALSTLQATANTIVTDVITLGSPMQAYTQPTGFLAATFSGTVANTTNITAGTITTTTNLTNAPTIGDFTSTMKTSITTAASSSTPVATLSGDLTSTMKTSVTTAATAATPIVSIASGAISDASFTIPTLSGPATGPVGFLTQLFHRFFFRTVYDSMGGTLKVYKADSTTVETSQITTDSAGVQTAGKAS